MIMCLALLVELRLMTDVLYIETDTRPQHNTEMQSVLCIISQLEVLLL